MLIESHALSQVGQLYLTFGITNVMVVRGVNGFWPSAFQMHPSKSKNVLLNGNEKPVSLGWAPGLLPGALAETGAQHGRLALVLPSSPASSGSSSKQICIRAEKALLILPKESSREF